MITKVMSLARRRWYMYQCSVSELQMSCGLIMKFYHFKNPPPPHTQKLTDKVPLFIVQVLLVCVCLYVCMMGMHSSNVCAGVHKFGAGFVS